jgi:hypothetical protein
MRACLCVGTLTLDAVDREKATLLLEWRCRFAGLGSATVTVPIQPHGLITFTIPKKCSGSAKLEVVELSSSIVG